MPHFLGFMYLDEKAALTYCGERVPMREVTISTRDVTCAACRVLVEARQPLQTYVIHREEGTPPELGSRVRRNGQELEVCGVGTGAGGSIVILREPDKRGRERCT